MLAVPSLKPPVLTLLVVWQPEPLQSRVPNGMWLLGLVTRVMLTKVVATVEPWQDRHPVTPWLDDDDDLRQHHPRYQPEQPHSVRHPRLQRLGLPHDEQRQYGWLQARHGEHLEPDAQRGRSHHRNRRRARVRHLP